MRNAHIHARFLSSSALLALLASGAVALPSGQPDCDIVSRRSLEECRAQGVRPVGVASASVPLPPDQISGHGFQIVVDGQKFADDQSVAAIVQTSEEFAGSAEVSIVLDGLAVEPLLAISLVRPAAPPHPGEGVTIASRMNYPAFVTRSELRLIDREANSSDELVAIVPIAPNGQASFPMLKGKRIVAVHRVYDAEGRYDESADLPVSGRSAGQSLGDRGETYWARQRVGIPVSGGGVTISVGQVAPDVTVRAFGETIPAGPDGPPSLQRILPIGQHQIDVDVAGPGGGVSYAREIEIPRVEMFNTAMTDVTIGRGGLDGGARTFTRGRAAFYTSGRTAAGTAFVVSADTSDAAIRDLFSSSNGDDPTSLLRRMDPDEAYPTYGDGSTIVEDAPTQGKLYARVERGGSYAVWGNSRPELRNTEYLRNERTLYGATVHWQAPELTGSEEPVAQMTAYASRPDSLVQRDVLRGTGGSIYFLSRQDIVRGSGAVSVELRDPRTGRVLERRQLTPSEDYEINHLQGSVRLAKPLPPAAGSGTVVTGPDSDAEVNLVVQYEYAPTGMSTDGVAAGGRIETWIADRVRLGVSGQSDDTGVAAQRAYGADVHYRIGKSSFIEAEWARSSGPGRGSRASIDGGLIYDTANPSGGAGLARHVEARLDLADLGLPGVGTVEAYHERRGRGFTSVDHSVASAERSWGFDASIRQSDSMTWRVYWDAFKNDLGKRDRDGGVELRYAPGGKAAYALAVAHVDRNDLREAGRRTDVALRYTRLVTDSFSWSALGQVTAAKDGLPRNDRIGFGVARDFGNGWTLAAAFSDGDLGVGGELLASYASQDGSTLYFGYEVDPDDFDQLGVRTGLGGSKGRLVSGGRRQLSREVSIYGENTYDLSDRRGSLTSSFGIDISPSQQLTYTLALTRGKVMDEGSGDLDRHGLSVGAKYQDDDLTASGRFEYRRERNSGTVGGSVDRDADTLLLTGNVTYRIDEAQSLLGYVDYADTDTDESSIRDGRLTDVVVGYALRPVDHDQFNLLAKYRYYHDLYGQSVDGADVRGPRQKSHILTVDAEYELTEKWSIGGRLGCRLARTDADGADAFQRNDAWLTVANARYHVVQDWDILVELRALYLSQAKASETSLLAAAYRRVGDSVKIGAGYNFGSFSDDLSDLTRDEKGVFLNVVAAF